MDGDLTNAAQGKSPTFLVGARKDPYNGNLDCIQIVKGWLDRKGELQEKVYDAVWSGGRKRNAENTVDVKRATWTNTIGSPELITVWKDPDCDPVERAFSYSRAMEIPTPR